MSKHIIHNSEFTEWAAAEGIFDDSKFHAVLCDPPYGLEFMGKDWDKFDIRQPGDPRLPMSSAGPFRRAKVRHAASPGYGKAQQAKQGFQEEVKKWGKALLPLLYPGALVFMFAGPRMWHRLATGMEDAGFHLWDTMMWLYGQGFPKARDLSKELGSNWAGYKTPQLKPAWEPILCFKAPADNTYVELATEYGSGCLNVGGGRIDTGEGGDNRDGEKSRERRYTESGSTNFAAKPGARGGDIKGRYPANLVLDEASSVMLDEQTGILTSGKSKPEYRKKAKNNVYGMYANDDMPINVVGDSGGASRFFYCAKASRSEREAGLTGELKAFGMSNQAKAEIARGTIEFENSELGVNSVKMVRNNHPTVKPIDLNRWLATLLLPPSSVKLRRILVPFAGVGSEMIGAMSAGWDEVVGVEMSAEYCKIAEQRIKYWAQ